MTTYNFTHSNINQDQMNYEINNLNLSAGTIIYLNYDGTHGELTFTNIVSQNDKTLLDNYFANYIHKDPSNLNINIGTLYGINTNLHVTATTGNQTYEIVDIGHNNTDTIVMEKHEQTLTNKTLTDQSNTVATKQILYDGNGGTGGNIDIYTSVNAPITGQCLIAGGSSNAYWGNLGIASLKNTSNQTIQNGTNTTLTLNSTHIATTNSNDVTLNASSHTITVGISGVYHVVARVDWSNSPGSGLYKLMIANNGNIVQETNLGLPVLSGLLAAPNNSQTLTTYLNLSAGDVLTVVVNQNSGTTQTIDGSSPNNAYLFVKRVC